MTKIHAMSPPPTWSVALACAILIVACGGLGHCHTCAIDFDALTPAISPFQWLSRYWHECAMCCNTVRVGYSDTRIGHYVCMDSPINGTGVISVGSDSHYLFERGIVALGVKFVRVYSQYLTSVPNHAGVYKFHRHLNTAGLMVALRRIIKHGTRVSIIKLDCDGCEHTVLTKSVLTTLYRQNTVIIVTLSYPSSRGWRSLFIPKHTYSAAYQMAAMWKLFVQCNYNPFHKHIISETRAEYSFIPTK